jgi:N-acetylmuramoyl-L-alanine amidase
VGVYKCIPSIIGYCVLTTIVMPIETALSQPNSQSSEQAPPQSLPKRPSLVAVQTPGRLVSWRFSSTQPKLAFKTTRNVQPQAQVVANPGRLVIDLPGVRLGRRVAPQTLSGVFRSLRIAQFNPSTTRIVVELVPGYTLDPQRVQLQDVNSRSWTVQLPQPQPIQAGRSPSTPTTTISSRPLPTSGRPLSTIRAPRAYIGAGTQPDATPESSSSSSEDLAEIESAALSSNNSQLMIRSEQPLLYTSGWDRATGAYRINVTGRLADNFEGPKVGGDSPILRFQVRQENPSTTVFLIMPAAGVRVGILDQRSPSELALPFSGLSKVATSRPENRSVRIPKSRPSPPREPQPSASIPIPVPPPERQSIAVSPPTNTPTTPQSLPRIRGRYVVLIDPGHGGPDPGAIGIGGIQEKQLVLDISRQVAAVLERQGVQVVMSRSDDRDLDLAPRVQLASRVNASIFVSIHANAISMSRPDINGIETYYYSEGGGLARAIHQNVLRTTGARDRGVRTARFYVLRRSAMPAVLVETGYVTGREDAARLAKATGRAQLAEGIARGILQYLKRG